MSEQSAAQVPATTAEPKTLAIGQRGVVITSLDDMWRFSQWVVAAGMAPKGFTKEAVCVAMQLAFELGLSPMTGIQNIAVINGRPSIWGDAAKALCDNSGLMEEFDEWYEVGGKRVKTLSYPDLKSFPDHAEAVCLSKRRGRTPIETHYSVADAKLALLWGKTGRDGQTTPWVTNPKIMLKFRARGFNLRDNFPDVLKGMRTAEELQDMPVEFVENVPNGPPIGRVNLRELPSQAPAAAEAPSSEDQVGGASPHTAPDTSSSGAPAAAATGQESEHPAAAAGGDFMDAAEVEANTPVPVGPYGIDRPQPPIGPWAASVIRRFAEDIEAATTASGLLAVSERIRKEAGHLSVQETKRLADMVTQKLRTANASGLFDPPAPKGRKK